MSHGEKEFDNKYYKRFFDKYSKKELEMYCRWADGWIRFLDSYLDIKEGQKRKVLELGASLGYFSKVFKDRGFRVWATDISSYIVKKAKKFQKGVSFSTLDVEKGIYIREQFDYIIAFEVLEHLKSPARALKNIKAKLKKGGTVIFSTPFPTKRSLADPTHINVHRESWWMKLGKETGFKNLKMVHATFIPFLYRVSSIFSFGFPVKTDIPFVNCTVFFLFQK